MPGVLMLFSRFQPSPLTPSPILPYTFHNAESKFHKAETVEEPGSKGR